MSLPPSSNPEDNLEESLSPDCTPRATPQLVCNAVDCLIHIVTKWNNEWGAMLKWSHQFMSWYITMKYETRTA